MNTSKTRFSLGAASAAVAVGLAAQAQAATTTNGTIVTVTGADNSAASVNAASSGVAGAAVTVTISTGASVVQSGSAIMPSQQGAVSINNRGTLGTTGAPVGVVYAGTPASATNTFDLANTGTITGSVSVTGVGGTTNLVNSGTVEGSLFAAGTGAITVRTGAVKSGAAPAVAAASVGGVSIAVDGVIGTAGSDEVASALRGVNALSVATETTTTGPTVATAGGVTTTTETQSSELTGSSAVITVEASGASGAVLATGFSGAAVTVEGAVGAEDQTAGVTASSNFAGGRSASRTQSTSSASGSTYAQHSETASVGGDATVEIAAGALVSGPVTASGLQSADVTVDGTVGREGFFTSVNARSGGTVSTSDFASTFDVETGNQSSSFSTTNGRNGGDAAVAIGKDGLVLGSVNARADGDASIGNAGKVTGTLNARASEFVSNAQFTSDSTDTYVSGDTVSTQTFTDSSTSVSETVGGSASVSNSATAEAGFASVAGLAGAALDNAGTIENSAAVTSLGGRFESTSDDTSTATFTTTDGGTYRSAYTSLDESTSGSATTGGSASLENSSGAKIGAGPGVNVAVSGFAGAQVLNAGTINANLSAASTGSAYGDQSSASYAETADADGVVASAYDYDFASTNASTGGSASLSNAAGGLIGLNDESPVSVSLSANGDAALANAGRINGFVTISAEGTEFTAANGFSSSFDLDRASGVTTTSEENYSSSSSASSGGSASFANAAGGLVVGSLDARGDAGVRVDNAGVVTGTTYAASDSFSGTSAFQSVTTTVVTPGDGGGTVSDYAETASSSSVNDGANVTGSYGGFNGAVQFTTSGASDGSVTQVANGNSVAAVTGTVFGNFTGIASGYASQSESTYVSHSSQDADGNQTDFTSQSENAFSFDRTGGSSTLAVAGGTVSGSANVRADGNASAQLGNGAQLGGNLNVIAGAFGNSSSGTGASTYDADYVDGDFSGSTTVTGSTFESSNLAGSASIAIGDADIGGSVSANGRKGGASLDLAAAGAIAGSAFVSASGSDSQSASLTTTVVSDEATVVDGASSSSSTVNGGNASANVSGSIAGSLAVGSNAGNASVVLSGQVGSNISVSAFGYSSTNVATSHSDGDGVTSSSGFTLTPAGGTASLAVNAPSFAAPANFGSISVAGLAGSTATIGAKSAVLAGDYSTSLNVGSTYYAIESTFESVDPASGLASDHEVETYTATGGPASLINAGRIGYDNGSDSAELASVNVASIGGASVQNSGKIFGSLSANALAANYVVTTDRINLGDVTRVDTFTTQYTAVGGNAAIANSGLITGSVSLAGATGSLTNTGKIGGDIVVGASVDNYTTTAVDTLTQVRTEVVTARAETPFVQTYTVNQNGSVGGDIIIGGAFGNFTLAAEDSEKTITTAAVDTTIVDAEGRPLTSVINATVNLGNNSVTEGGIYAEYDAASGERFTNTVVNIASTARLDGGVYGVEKLNKQGTGVFKLTGPSYVAATDTAPAEWTLDLGQFEILSGEVQLATSDGGTFGIRGDVTNAASLVLGTRQQLSPTLFGSNLTATATQTVSGVDIYQQGDFVQTATGSLSVAMMPSLVRVIDPSIDGQVISNEPLGVQQVRFAQGLFTTPQNAFGSQFAALYAPSTWTIDGDLALAGTVNLLMPKGGLFLDGQSLDLFSVSGRVTENATIATGTQNNFVSFDLVSRTSDGRTIVAVVADRKGYETAAGNTNAAAAGTALTAALPGVVASLTADAKGTASFDSVAQFALTQDLATVMAGLDSQLTLAQASQALNELGGGSYYGSLATIRTTAPFVDVLSNRRLPEGATGFDLWIEPTGDFMRVSGSSQSGASKLRSNTYGGSAGFGVATGSGEFGIGFGYARTNASSQDGLAHSNADTWMVGGYARQSFDALTVAANVVMGWSKWDAYRALPTLSRQATASFDSKETRADLRIEYALDLGGANVAPFGQIELRHYSFDGFDEVGAGSVGLAVAKSAKTVVTPTLGIKLGGAFETSLATIRPEASISYSFQGDVEANRTVSFLGAPAQTFRLNGVDQNGYVTVQGGLFADIGSRSGVFLRGSVSTGGGNSNAAIRTGVVIGF